MRDAAGITLAIYKDSQITEHSIYGASRLGVYNRTDGSSCYQLTDHLGSVRAVVTRQDDKAVALVATDYYPFGMPMPGRDNGPNSYRYKYQGQEKDIETGKEAFQLRLWDSRIGRWLSPDPMGQYHSPYLGMGNNPVNNVDPDGGWVVNAIAAVVGAAINTGINIYSQHKEGTLDWSSGKTWARIGVAAGTGALAGLTLNPALAVTQAAIVNGIGDIGDQLIVNGGDFNDIDYTQAAIIGVSTYIGGKYVGPKLAKIPVFKTISRNISYRVHSSKFTSPMTGQITRVLNGGVDFGKVNARVLTAFSETVGGLGSAGLANYGNDLADRFQRPEFKFEPIDPFKFNDWALFNNQNYSGNKPKGILCVGPTTQSGPVGY